MAQDAHEALQVLVSRLSDNFPGYGSCISQISNLVAIHPPPFVYINDPETPRTTSSVLNTVLSSLCDPLSGVSSGHNRIYYALVNAVACFTPRLLYDSLLNSLAGWHAEWDNGCKNWATEDEKPVWNDNVDHFVHGLKALHADLLSTDRSPVGKSNINGNAEAPTVRMVIVVERAEKLKESMPELIVPLTRLAEMSQLDISVIFISDVPWEDIRPSLGASPEPYYLDIQTPGKPATIARLVDTFDRACESSDGPKSPFYNPVLRPLHEHFASTLYDICSPFTKDPDEIVYISAARWPGFVQPLLDEHQRTQSGMNTSQEEDEDSSFTLPKEDVRMRLTHLFRPTITAALAALYPRLTNAADWAKENMPEQNLLSNLPGRAATVAATPSDQPAKMEMLPRMSKFILVAAFLASTNPATSDIRIFGRRPEERRKRRRKRAARVKSGTAKVPRRLLGPAPFPLDRLIAILGVLLEENDGDIRPPAPDLTFPGEYTEMEISRVHIYAAVTQLASIHLLHRVTTPEKLDGPPLYKCGIPYEVALSLGRQLDIPLHELMWEPA